MKKNKILKIFAIIFSIPIILTIILALYSSIFGVDFIFSSYNGIDAFIGTILFLVIFIWPVYIICIGYLIFYLLYKIYQKVKNKKLYVILVMSIFITIIFCFLLLFIFI